VSRHKDLADALRVLAVHHPDLSAQEVEDLAEAAMFLDARDPDAVCTELAATWCPVHGLCVCSRYVDGPPADTCRLHATTSAHRAVAGLAPA